MRSHTSRSRAWFLRIQDSNAASVLKVLIFSDSGTTEAMMNVAAWRPKCDQPQRSLDVRLFSIESHAPGTLLLPVLVRAARQRGTFQDQCTGCDRSSRPLASPI